MPFRRNTIRTDPKAGQTKKPEPKPKKKTEAKRRVGRPASGMRELESKMRDASKGHDMLLRADHGTSASFRCGKCGMEAGIARVPPPGKPKFSGQATEEPCPC